MTTSASDLYSHLVQEQLPSSLAERGFSKSGKGALFVQLKQGNWAVVDFQKSQSSRPDLVRFTVTAGIALGRLRKEESLKPHLPPRIEECHWSRRIGQFMQTPQDKWWVINPNTPIREVETEILDLLDKSVLPQVQPLMSEEALRDHWLAGYSHGITEGQRLRYLTRLLELIGRGV